MAIEKKQTRASLERELKAAGNAERTAQAARYFKTGKGEYGEGDVFLGIPVPAMRRIALRYRMLPLDDLQKLLDSRIHEYRAAALEILVAQYARGDEGIAKLSSTSISGIRAGSITGTWWMLQPGPFSASI